ncbi:hypothetical protein [Mycobacterium sp. OTB74]|jgi:hypothetical protein|nr:hypothetical protein [Mycobacterium sp. OTB74]MDH6245664.1 hypothetical protein [Mycobacterium sp. OTB74]
MNVESVDPLINRLAKTLAAHREYDKEFGWISGKPHAWWSAVARPE